MQANTCILFPMPKEGKGTDLVFKAMADPNRRKVLDLLFSKNGQTLGQLCEELEMQRQSATQHIEILINANLITVIWKGREKLHFINPVPIYEVYERWVRKFEENRLGFLHDLKKQLEGENHGTT
jgi:DNA-binding transcriptional ArsR family regulator